MGLLIQKCKIKDAIYGLAIGDALGCPYEFNDRERVRANPCTDMIGYGTFDKPAGTWTDDTSMTLAMLDGLAEEGDEHNAIMRNFNAWLDGAYTTEERPFDIGRTCLKAIMNFTRGTPPLECGLQGENYNGNGSLMRILPAALFSLAKYDKIDTEFINDMSALTHAHEISKMACNIYARIVKEALMPQSMNAIKKKAVEIVKKVTAANEEQTAFDRLKSLDFFDLPEEEIKSSGYVVDTLEAALWCFCNTTTYKQCVLKAVNLGHDTDTVAAVAGSLAGLRYIIEKTPKAWVERLRGKEIIDKSITKFYNRIKKFRADYVPPNEEERAERKALKAKLVELTQPPKFVPLSMLVI
jgi:ADP-ribosylglycohydrolase